MLKNFAFGAVFGVANIIPGVSGGTVAFLLGFYERLIQAITRINKAFCFDTLDVLRRKESFKKYFDHYDLAFILQLGSGAVLAVLSLAKVMQYLLMHHREVTYGFFLGLVVCSLWMPIQHIKKWSPLHLGLFLFFAYGTASLNFLETRDDKIARAERKEAIKQNSSTSTPLKSDLLPYVFAGAIAASAMILPGISGSFMLVIMGVYFDILTAIAQKNILLLASVALGCVLGLLLFTRILKYLLARHSDLTLWSMLGLMTGSLVALWPFREITSVGLQRVETDFIWIADSSLMVATAISFVAGSMIVLGFYRVQPKS